MRLLTNNTALSVLKLVACEGIQYNYNYYQVDTDGSPLGSDCYLDDTNMHLHCKVLRSEYVNKVFSSVLVPVETFQLYNTVYPSFTGRCTVRQLLNKLGVPNELKCDTGIVYWRVPSMRCSRLLDYLSTYSVMVGGGASNFSIGLNGKVQCIDPHLAYSSASHGVVLNIPDYDFDKRNLDWYVDAPGSYIIHDGSNRSEFVISRNYGQGSYFLNNTTGNELDLAKRCFTTRFWNHFYQARLVGITEGTINLSVGDVVLLDGTTRGVVSSKTSTIPLNDEAPQISYVIELPYEGS